jgi:hypothetical protein
MTLPELSIKRHVLAWMLSAVLVLFGVISYDRIGMDRYPYIEFPVVSITTALKGANPDIVDASVTNIIESSVNSTPGHRAHSVHFIARRLGDCHHLQPGKEDRRRLQRGPGQGQSGAAPPAQGC